ncbi:MAG: hypothetical protein HIU82_03270, partial [Proteobacteria bacterium]|nr:hypothetical protein [Pseudomonadota bacterium]
LDQALAGLTPAERAAALADPQGLVRLAALIGDTPAASPLARIGQAPAA